MMSHTELPVNLFESNLVLNHILNFGCRGGSPQGGQAGR